LIGLARTLSEQWDAINTKFRESTVPDTGLLSKIGSYFSTLLPSSLTGVSDINLHSQAYVDVVVVVVSSLALSPDTTMLLSL
jgi:hypothetical protein